MRRAYILAFCLLLSSLANAQERKRDLNIETHIDSVYVFGFDLSESRSAKGGIWNTETGKPETPLNYTKAKRDTVDSVPVVRLYRQVVPGNHPLNGWEIWSRTENGWIRIERDMPASEQVLPDQNIGDRQSRLSCGSPKDNSFVIEGNITGVRDSVTVVLFKIDDLISKHGKGVATDTLINGKFSFDIPIEDSLDRYNIIIVGDRYEFPPQGADIFAEPGKKAIVTGTGVSLMKWKVRSNVKKQRDWQTYMNYTADVSSEIGLAAMDRSMAPEKRHALCDSLNRVCFVKALEYFESEKTSDIWIDEFHSWAKYAGIYKNKEMKEKLKALLPRISDEQMKTPLMSDALPYLDISLPLNIGDAFPELNLYDADGLPHKVSDFSGKKLLIEFSQLGCAPCRHARPEIEELCRMHPDGFAAIIVNQNGYEAWRKGAVVSEVPNIFEFNDDNGSSGIFKRLGARGYPAFVLISTEGIITDMWAGYAQGSLMERF